MAEVNSRLGRGKKGKPSRVDLRVDFTPMVDMNMLLITFFMFCTTLSAPQVMDIVMPTKDIPIDEPITTSNLKTTTLILGANNKVHYYEAFPDYDNPANFKTTDLSPDGLRAFLLGKNSDVVQEMKLLKVRRAKKEISEAEFKTQMSEIRKQKGGQTVIIKPTDASSYRDLINTLDEMQICGINKYAIVELEKADHFLLNNFSNGTQIAELVK